MCVAWGDAQVIYMLCEACKEGKVDIVSWMCMHNDDIPALVNTRSRCGLLPMDYACMYVSRERREGGPLM